MDTSYPLQVRMASVTARGGAWLVDIVASVIVAVVVLAVVSVVSEALAMGSFLLILVGWYVVSEAVWGQTPGKRLVGIKVVDTNGNEISAGPAIVRNITKIVGGSSLLFILAGVVLIADSRDNQRLGDRLAETLVVRA
ncbi:RDD family protein [Halorubrum sp. DTA46]|uniref:RDD family protein n=1 Tax=Halorubrum sp. DTA46 TaxID=3402162 RepID=UPI003AAA5BB7